MANTIKVIRFSPKHSEIVDCPDHIMKEIAIEDLTYSLQTVSEARNVRIKEGKESETIALLSRLGLQVEVVDSIEL